jgi:hypothetical protein
MAKAIVSRTEARTRAAPERKLLSRLVGRSGQASLDRGTGASKAPAT